MGVFFILAALGLLAFLLFIAAKKLSSPAEIAPITKMDIRPNNRAITRAPIQDPSARWICAGERIEIRGIAIIAGLIYVGRASPISQFAQTTNCIIDQNLRVADNAGDKLGQSMPYWPSYLEIAPKARRTYLEWLAGGRTDPNIGIGYVFLFFYGLERRFFIDQAKQEAAIIAAEVRRLLTLFGENSSFRNYATQFLDALMLFGSLPRERPTISIENRSGFAIPTRVRFYLGMRLAEEGAFDSDDALLWILSLPDFYPRTPVTRCFGEFVALWKLRFAGRWPQNLKPTLPGTPFTFRYQGASGVEAAIDVKADGTPIPDIAAITGGLADLKDLAAECSNALDGYSRLLGRRPEASGTLEATLLLPKDIRATAEGSLVQTAAAALESAFNGRPIALLPTAEILGLLGLAVPSNPKISGPIESQIGEFFDLLDVGFEPDCRYGSTHLVADGKAILFKSPGGAIVDPERPAYLLARTAVEATALAAWADGTPGAEEFKALKECTHSANGLSTTERARLLGYAGILIQQAPQASASINRVAKLPEDEKRRIGMISVKAVMADKDASPIEIRYLEKLFKTLGLAPQDLYAALHRLVDPNDEPVLVMKADPDRGATIPKQSRVPESSIQFDQVRLARVREETSTVSALLSEIFVDNEPQIAKPALSSDLQQRAVAGLDEAHGQLLEAIIVENGMKKDVFENRARSLRLLPDGALETINEWGFENFDEAVIEDEEIIKVAPHLMEGIRKLRANA